MMNNTTTLLGNEIFKNAKLYKRPEFPKIEFVKDKVNYRVTNLTYLNRDAVNILITVINGAIENPDAVELAYVVPENITDDELNIITEICCGIEYEAKKRGRNGWSVSGSFLINGCMTETVRNRKTVTFFINKEYSRIIKDYMKKWGNTVNIYDLVVAVANETHRMAEQWGGEKE